MRKYWFNGILAMVCLVLLVGLPINARAEMAGVTVTAVLEKDASGPSPGPSDDDPEEEPNDDSDDNPDGEPDDDSDDNPDGESDDDSGDNPEDEQDDGQDDNSDGVPADDTTDDASGEDPNDNSEENSDGITDVSENGKDDVEADQNPDSESEESDEESKLEENEGPYGKLIRMLPIVIALIGIGIFGGITGLWAYLWLLFTWYLLKSRRSKWHGILTEEENRFIEIRPTTDDYRLAQNIIDYSLNPAEALQMLEETGDLTYLPESCKVSVSYWLDGEYRMEKVRCDESKVYELMESLGNVREKKVLIENRVAQIRILLMYP